MTPYWERELKSEADLPHWHRIPQPLRLDFWNSAPFAMLHKSSTASKLELKRGSTLTRQIRDAIKDACINAGLRDLPFEEEAQKQAQANPAEPEPLDLGWFVHNSGSTYQFVALVSALMDCGCEIDPLEEAGDITKEYGDVGAAHGVLMLTEALIRVAQLQIPVLTAQFGEKNSIEIGLIRPFPENPPTEQV
jgi:hypothetical protein